MRFNKGMTMQKFEAQKEIQNRIMSIHLAISLTGRAYVCDIAHAYAVAKDGISVGADIDYLRRGLLDARRYSSGLRRSRNDYN